MLKKMLLILFSLTLAFTITGCESNEQKQDDIQQQDKIIRL